MRQTNQEQTSGLDKECRHVMCFVVPMISEEIRPQMLTLFFRQCIADEAGERVLVFRTGSCCNPTFNHRYLEILDSQFVFAEVLIRSAILW